MGMKISQEDRSVWKIIDAVHLAPNKHPFAQLIFQLNPRPSGPINRSNGSNPISQSQPTINKCPFSAPEKHSFAGTRQFRRLRNCFLFAAPDKSQYDGKRLLQPFLYHISSPFLFFTSFILKYIISYINYLSIPIVF